MSILYFLLEQKMRSRKGSPDKKRVYFIILKTLKSVRTTLFIILWIFDFFQNSSNQPHVKQDLVSIVIDFECKSFRKLSKIL